jgi:hypothetical protein
MLMLFAKDHTEQNVHNCKKVETFAELKQVLAL